MQHSSRNLLLQLIAWVLLGAWMAGVDLTAGSVRHVVPGNAIGLPGASWSLTEATNGELETVLLIARGSIWSYWDQGATPGGNWMSEEFDDSSWARGPALFGYGDGDEATVVRYGADSTNKFITTWFRRRFVVSDPGAFESLRLEVLRDDGVAVYVNGAEVARDNLPSGPLAASTRATTAVGGADERTYHVFVLDPGCLRSGTNWVAVELHQSSPTSSDAAMDLALSGICRPFVAVPLMPDPIVPGEAGAIELAVSVSDPSGLAQFVTVQFEVRPASSGGSDFTVAVLPDTQNYTGGLNGGKPAIFTAQTTWLARECTARNLRFVTHVGDVVEHGDYGGTNVEWLAAAEAMSHLEDAATTGLPEGIPYGIAVGNHDQSPNGAPGGASYFYNLFFGTNRFAGRSYWGGRHGTNNDNHFERFEGGGRSWLALHLEYGAETDAAVLAWALQVLRSHPRHLALVSSHGLLNPGMPGTFTAAGRVFYDTFKTEPNLVLMVCGHAIGEGWRTDEYAGRKVHTLLADYQGRANGGDGWLRLLELSPNQGILRVRTYSPWLAQAETDADSAFDLPLDLDRGPWADVAIAAARLPASRVAVRCDGVESNADYEWRVRVKDGLRSWTSATWRLRTGEVGEPPTPPLKLEIAPGMGETVELRWSGIPGTHYRVEWKSDLSRPTWMEETNLDVVAVLRRLRLVVPHDDAPARYFRVREVGP